MKFEQVLPALREGKAIQRTSQPIQWAYLKRSENGAFHWYGFGDDPNRGSPMHLDHTDLLAEDWVVLDEADARARRPEPSHSCRRRLEQGRQQEGVLLDHWRDRAGQRTCSYCGSVHPDDLMARLEAGEVELGPTDKSYKVYVTGPDYEHAKFYFQHFSVEQRKRFVELLNEKRLRLGAPGHFYTVPFFVTFEKSPAS